MFFKALTRCLLALTTVFELASILNGAAAATPPIPLVVTTLRKRVERDYNLMGQTRCLRGGYLYCEGPWFYPDDWLDYSRDVQVRPDTPYGYCHTDSTYLTYNYHYFWGWSSTNLSSILTNVGIRAGAFATHTCLYDKKCNSTYSGKPQKMYDAFWSYTNATFSAPLQKFVQKTKRATFCPPYADYGAFGFTTDIPDFGVEMFGLHQPILVPGVFDSDSAAGLIQQQRAEAQSLVDNTMAGVEGIFLYMVFGAKPPTTQSLGSQHGLSNVVSEEIFPGCFKHDFVRGRCQGIVPPRAWDLDGRIMPMAEREKLGLRGTSPSPKYRLGSVLAALDSRSTCPAIDQIDHNIESFKNLRIINKSVEQAMSAYGMIMGTEAAAEFGALALGTVLGPEIIVATACLGTAWLIVDTAVSFCGLGGSCDFMPQAVKDGVETVHNAQDYSDIVQSAVEGDFVGAAIGSFKAVTGISADGLLQKIIEFQEYAKKCCAKNCGGGVCGQAAGTCAKEWLHPSCND